MQGISPIGTSFRYSTFLTKEERLSPKASISRIYESNPFPNTNPISKSEIKKARKLKLEEYLSILNGDMEKFEIDMEAFEEDSEDLNSIFDNIEDSDSSNNSKDIDNLNKILKDISNLQKDLEIIEKDLEKVAQLKEAQLSSVNMPLSAFFDKLNQAKKIPKLAKSFERIKKMLALLMGILKLSSKTGFNFGALISRNAHFKKVKAALFKELHSVLNWRSI